MRLSPILQSMIEALNTKHGAVQMYRQDLANVGPPLRQFRRMSEADTSSRQNHVFHCSHIGAPRPQLVFELLQFLSFGSWISVFRTHARNAKTLQRSHTSFILLSIGWNAYGFLSDWGLMQRCKSSFPEQPKDPTALKRNRWLVLDHRG